MDTNNAELHYVRIRGRVYGPYDNARLKQMVGRGQLSRLHEISIDGQSWLPASSQLELFDSSPISLAPLAYSVDALRSNVALNLASGDDAELKLENETALNLDGGKSNAVWFVGGVDMTVGPVDAPRISALVRRGELKPNSLVWRKGMADWVQLQDAPELAELMLPEKPGKGRKRSTHQPLPEPSLPQIDSSNLNAGVDGDLVSELIFRACKPMPWITCVAAVLAAMAIIFIVGGLIVLGQGLLSQHWSLILIGVMCVALAVTSQFAVYFLLRYRQRLQTCHANASLLALVYAHQALGRLWLFAGITITVLAQIGLAGFIWWLFDRQGVIQFLSGN